MNDVRPNHYNMNYSRNLNQQELAEGRFTVKLDPYRIGEIYAIGGGAREQILKKALRWTSKGGSEIEVLNEIMQACQRGLEIIQEDNTPMRPAPAAPISPQPVSMNNLNSLYEGGGGSN